jgi:hypothetical protein
MIQRLYDMDASAFALLAATADQDSMTIEEYLADVLARRISATAEEKSFPFSEIAALQAALKQANSLIGPTIDQGVEVVHAQRAIRGLMSDVVWHRPPWWRPRWALPPGVAPPAPVVAPVAEGPGALPAEPVVLPADATQAPAPAETPSAVELAGSAAATEPSAAPANAQGSTTDESAAPIGAAAEVAVPAVRVSGEGAGATDESPPSLTTRTDERLKWLKRCVRFGTVLRSRANPSRYIVNLTQACDIQSEKLANVGEVHYLFMQGLRIPVDRVAIGEKLFDSPYYREEAEEDEFFTLQWRLRQPFTPSIGVVLDTLEKYEIVGQLRSEAAYAVLAKYMSQASRVALVRMPKVYRYSVSVYHKHADGSWLEQVLPSPVEASAWQRDATDWRLQFSVNAARALLGALSGVTDAKKESFVSALTSGLKVETKGAADLNVREIEQTTALLMRVDGKAEYEVATLSGRIASVDKCKAASVGTTVLVTRAIS